MAFPLRSLRWLLVERPIRFTRFGIFYILFTLAIGAAAINTGNNLLYLILGILLGFIVISGFLSDSCLWGLASDWRLPASCYAGSLTTGECRLRKGWFPAVLVRITAHWDGAAPTTHLISWLGGRKEELFRFSVTPQKRGWLRLVSVDVATLFPFGLFKKFHSFTRDDRWLVYPALQPIDLEDLRAAGAPASGVSQERRGVGEIPYMLRDYRDGDAARLIHWKTSARRQRFIVKEMEEQTSPTRWLGIARWPSADQPDQLEDFVSFAASFIRASVRRGRSVGLVTPDFRAEPNDDRAHLHRIYQYLALYDPRIPQASRSLSIPPGTADLLTLWEKTA